MKLVIIEPLGVEEDKLMEIAHKALPDSVEIISYQTKVTDTESLIERGKDADIIALDRDLNVRAVWAMGKLVEGTNKLF